MPRGFLVKRHLVPVHEPLRVHHEDLPDITVPSYHHIDTLTPTYMGDSTIPGSLHTLVERLGFDPHIHSHSLYLYSEPLELTSPPPLDLSIKTLTPITPPSTPSPSSPVRKRHLTEEHRQPVDVTPRAPTPPPASQDSTSKKSVKSTPTPKRTKAVRRLNFDEDKTSPVSGTIIRELRDDEAPLVVRKGDIDPAFNVVEVTEEAKAELAKIENRIGDYICKLCKEMYEDAFTLAQHRCSRIVHVEYRCPECDKVFNCPANLASHRRWHKPRPATKSGLTDSVPIDLVKRCDSEDLEGNSTSSDVDAPYPCPVCQKRFRRQAYLRKHLSTHHHQEEEEEGPPPLSPTYLPPPPVLPLRSMSPLPLMTSHHIPQVTAAN